MDKTQLVRDWAEVQIQLCQRQPQLYFKEREVWWGSIGINVGHEQDGRNYWCERPVLVLKKHTRDTALTIPITSQKKNGRHDMNVTVRDKPRTLLLSQARVLSSQRFSRKIGTVSKEEFEQVRQRCKDLI